MWNRVFLSNPAYVHGRGTALDPKLIDLYSDLADAQRGAPESAMSDAQKIMDGGVMSFVIEHVGDLTNRMAKDLAYGSGGYGYVRDKVEKTLSVLDRVYGFEREHAENMISNAKYHGVKLQDFKLRVDEALRKYAEAHAQLRVYNRVQFLARNAAVALGAQDFKRARDLLKGLKRIVDQGEEKWWEYATAPPDPQIVAMWPAWLPWALRATRHS